MCRFGQLGHKESNNNVQTREDRWPALSYLNEPNAARLSCWVPRRTEHNLTGPIGIRALGSEQGSEESNLRLYGIRPFWSVVMEELVQFDNHTQGSSFGVVKNIDKLSS